MDNSTENQTFMKRETMDVEEAASMLGVSIYTVYDLVRKKQIPHIRVARRILFRLASLQLWMSQQEAKNAINS